MKLIRSVCRYQCFKSAWMHQVLHEGFHFPKDYSSLRTVQLLYDREVQWTLGAILYKTRFLPLRYYSMLFPEFCEFFSRSQIILGTPTPAFWKKSFRGYFPSFHKLFVRFELTPAKSLGIWDLNFLHAFEGLFTFIFW